MTFQSTAPETGVQDDIGLDRRGARDTEPCLDGAGTFYGLRSAPASGVLHIRISGFWERETIDSFAKAMHAAIAALGRPPGEHLISCDVTAAAIQSQEIVDAFQILIVQGPTRARKLALFTSRVLSRMQARRIVGVRDQIAVFEDEATALRWLLEDEKAEG